MLLTKSDMNMNMENMRGLTVLDMLLESPTQYGDMEIAGLIVAAGGKNTSEGRPQQVAPPIPIPPNVAILPPQGKNSKWMRHLHRLGWCFGLSTSTQTYHLPRQHSDPKESNTAGTLMVVATLIATITFQPILSPPGGFDSNTGMPTRGSDLSEFLVFDMVGLFTSLSIILLLICVTPRRKRKMTKILVWVIWLAVYSTAWAFSIAAKVMFPGLPMVRVLIDGWFVILGVSMVGIYIRFTIYLLGVVGWWNMKQQEGRCSSPTMGVCLVIKRALVLLIMFVGVPWFLISVVPAITLRGQLTLVPFLKLWSLGFEFPELCLCLRFILYLFRKAGWLKDGETDIPRIGAHLVIKRIFILVLIVAAISIFCYQVIILRW